MIESIWAVVAVVIIMGIGAIAAAIRIIAIRQNEGSSETEGGTGDEIGTSIVTHVNGADGFRRPHGLRVEGQ
jgi:hypothetical protein